MDTVHLGDDLGIEASTGLKERLAPYLDRADAVVLDATDVRRVHTAGMQVLCAFVLARQQAGQGTVFDNATDTFRDAARLLGVLRTLGLEATPDTTKSVENAA